ncbi:hypothetical protein J3Q64DRAFT_1018793 [Phycomyces blakesleeanus]|uniref:Uncharacterized protein n=1 Tax=Phycomyces blakesleeanus TaxID=4837 RepID=A0ABR3BC06_PHYBL
MYVCMYVCVYACMRVCVYACVRVCVWVCGCVGVWRGRVLWQLIKQRKKSRLFACFVFFLNVFGLIALHRYSCFRHFLLKLWKTHLKMSFLVVERNGVVIYFALAFYLRQLLKLY